MEMETELPNPLNDKDRLDQVVNCLKSALCDPDLRSLPYRAIQAKVWHHHGDVIASILSELRAAEHTIRSRIFQVTSALVFELHSVDATIARAGIVPNDVVHPGAALTAEGKSPAALCLDAKERLYVVLRQYNWLREFFYQYPLHFYENSFAFVERIPTKTLPITVAVVGLGIGGSMCASGLAKAGIQRVVGYEKRSAAASRSRYQNASWRAYDVAEDLLDAPAYEHLLQFRQQIRVTNEEDGTTRTVTADRVQIILGSAITVAQESAERYGADLQFSTDGPVDDSGADLVVYFAGAHTVAQFGLPIPIHTWPELSSDCDLWLCLQPSSHRSANDEEGNTCSRTGEVGAEKWHYTIQSARKTVDDVTRVEHALELAKQRGKVDPSDYEQKKGRIQSILEHLQEDTENHYDYTFTNAPINNHNRSKRLAAADSVVLDSGYTVDVALATSSTLPVTDSSPIKIMGGDACVPPNPAAAYGATLACESAAAATHLAVALGHLKAMEASLNNQLTTAQSKHIRELRQLYVSYFEAKSRSENYFQWIQTLICNLYSLPPMDS